MHVHSISQTPLIYLTDHLVVNANQIRCNFDDKKTSFVDGGTIQACASHTHMTLVTC